MKIYTKTGDEGETGLFGGGRVAKDDARVAAYGDVDELNAAIGFARALTPTALDADLLESVQREASDYLGQLLEHNSTRVVNDLDERVLESRRRLESEVRDRLREGLDSAVQALERARARQAEGSEAVARELARIEELRRRVRSLRGVPPPAN